MAPKNISKIVAEGKSTVITAALLKVGGWFCVPFFCLGCLCLAPGYICASFAENCKKLIELYDGRVRLNILAQKIKKEQELFRDAVTQANAVVQPSLIRPNVSLLDVISDMNPRIGPIIRSDITSIIFAPKDKSYSAEIWKNYQNAGGNFHVIVYGLIEYLFTVYPPDCTLVDSYVKKALQDSSLRTEMMSHKAAAHM